MLVRERYGDWGGGVRKDAAWGEHRGVPGCGRCEEEGDEGVVSRYFIFFFSTRS